jgi:hypothetical protein
MFKIFRVVKTPNGSAAIIVNPETDKKLMTVYGRIIDNPGIFGYVKKLGIVMLTPNNILHIFTKTNIVITRLNSRHENKIPRLVGGELIYSYDDDDVSVNICEIYERYAQEHKV